MATSASPPGNYLIDVRGASSPNYAFDYVDGTFIVTGSPPVTLLGVSIQTVAVRLHKTAQVIVLRFSAALNPGDAQNLGFYSLVTLNRFKKQTKSRPVAIAQARYNASTFTVTLSTRKRLVFNAPLQLTIQAGRLHDALGRTLGANLVRTLSKMGMTMNSPAMAAPAVRLYAPAVDGVLEGGLRMGLQ
jgi:hypothetical protein